MKFIKTDGNGLELRVIDFEREILINYTLVENSANKVISVDRGISSDRYEVTFHFRGKKDYISSIINELKALRLAKREVILYDCDEHFFGENIQHDVLIFTVITKMDKETSPLLNVYDVSVTFLADTSKLVFIGTSSWPEGMKCLQSQWEGYSKWNTQVNETYFRSNYFVDYISDAYYFSGKYILTTQEIQDLLSFHKSQRGSNFVITDTQLGTSQPFGSEISDTSHTVVITKLDYERISSSYNSVTLELRRQE